MSNAVKKKKKPVRIERILFIICCCSLPVIQWLIFYVYGNLSAFTMAFTDKNGNLSLYNFVRLWEELSNMDSYLTTAIINTGITFVISLIAYPFKVLVSYFIYKRVPGYKIYRILFFLPSMIFGVAIALIFRQMIGVNGPIAQAVQQVLGLEYAPDLLADSRFANIVVILHMLWLGFPGELVIWGGTFARIPTDVLESGRIDGVNWWQEFTKITVPLVWPTLSLQMVMMFCGIFNASGAVFLLTGGEFKTMTLSVWMYMQVLRVSGSIDTSNVFNYMSAVGMVMTVIAVAISLGIRRWTDKRFNDVEF